MQKELIFEKELEKTVKHYSNLLNLETAIKVKIEKGASYNGRYSSFSQKIYLNKLIKKTWSTERRVWEFVIAHELVHAKYKDPNMDGISGIVIPKIAVKNAFKELRANTIAFQLTNYSQRELEYYFDVIYKYAPRAIAITGGYLKGHEYIDFILNHPQWTNETIEAAGNYLKQYSSMYKLVSKKSYSKIKDEYLFALI